MRRLNPPQIERHGGVNSIFRAASENLFPYRSFFLRDSKSNHGGGFRFKDIKICAKSEILSGEFPARQENECLFLPVWTSTDKFAPAPIEKGFSTDLDVQRGSDTSVPAGFGGVRQPSLVFHSSCVDLTPRLG